MDNSEVHFENEEEQLNQQIIEVQKDVEENIQTADSLLNALEEDYNVNEEWKDNVKKLRRQVRLEGQHVLAVLRLGHSHLHDNWSFTLDVNLAELEFHYRVLKHKLSALLKHRRHFTTTTDLSVYLLNSGTRTSPLYEKLPNPREKRIALDLSGSHSSLALKGRRFVTRLSGSYRAVIKSSVQRRTRSASPKYSHDTERERSPGSDFLFTPRKLKTRKKIDISDICSEISYTTAESSFDNWSTVSGYQSQAGLSDSECGFSQDFTHKKKYGNLVSSGIAEPPRSCKMEATAGVIHSGPSLPDNPNSCQPFYPTGVSTPSRSGRRSPKYKEGRVSPIANGRRSPKGGGRRPQKLIGRFSPMRQDGCMSPASTTDGRSSPPMILDVGMSPSLNKTASVQEGRMSPTQSGRLSPSSGRKSPRAASLGPEESPIVTKRRKIVLDPLLDSPLSSASTDTLHQSFRDSPERSFVSSHDEWSDSCLSSPQASPLGLKARKAVKGNYKKAKEDLWAAIQSDYQYLMDDEIIETCKSTESDLSWDDDDSTTFPNVSFTEFIQQYKELTDWLNQIKLVTQRQSMSLSEKYLNQSYHEEMLQRSPRRKLFNDYAKQLAKRYPNMKEEINARLQFVNSQWGHIQEAISPKHGHQNEEQMLRDLEQDLNGLRRWLHEVEVKLLPLCLRATWSQEELEAKLKDHQVLQRDIESRSKIVSAVLKLCERLEGDKRACSDEDDKDTLQFAALNLERRWHAIWLQSLEWQCRLEEAISRKKGLITPVSQASSFGGFNFHSASQLSIPPTDIGDSERSDYTDTDIDDFNNSDIIPFAENEYEKITSEVDVQTEKDEKNTEKEPGSAIDDLLEAKDSNEKKSVVLSSIQGSSSNEPLEHASMEKGKQRTTKGTKGSVEGQQSSQEESKLEVMGSSPPTKDDDLYTMVVSALNGKDSTEETTASSDDSKLESHDVGYSSGGQSNEEVEYSITETTQEVKTTKILVKETQHTTISVKKDDTLEASVSEINDSTFTNVSSLPSAEESPYQAAFGNDSSQTQEDQEPNGEDSEKYEEALSSPSKRFYRMTSVEEEFAAENRGSNTEEMTQGYKSGTESDTQSNAKVRTRLDFLIQDLEHRLEEDTKPRSRTSSASAFGFDDEDSSSSLTSDEEHVDTQNNNSFIENLDTFEDYNHTLDTYKSHSKRSSDEKSESLAVQANSDSDHHQEVTQDDELDGAPNYDLEQAHIPNSRESVERLVRQAESFVRDGDFNIQTNRWTETSGKRRRRRKKKDTSTDSSANDNAGNYVESSCDASSEYTSDSESSSSNEENLYSSVIFKETTVTVETQNEGHVDSVTAQGSSLSATSSPNREVPHGVKMRRKTNRHKQNGRPWSVTELYELTNRLDFSPFSISEGALDALGGSQPDSLNKVTASGTELCSWRGATLHKLSPHPKRKHHTKLMKMKRSVSESEKLSQEPQVGSSESPREDNKSLSEHETLYAMVAGALDAREHAGSSQEERSQYSLHTGQLSAVSGEGNQSDLGDLVDTEKRDDSDKDSDDTDELLNSTVESFSEHAWDPYQFDTSGEIEAFGFLSDPPYQVVTSDDNEEKLDDSHLTWENEDNFEFDDDYIKDSGMFSAEFLSAMQPKQSTVDSALDGMATSAASNGYPSPSGYSGDSSRVDDSDSDMEDFQHVINESAKQIQVTETSLKKQRRDAMDTGLCMDPSKYAELVATCETNLRCLQVIIEHLNAGKSLVGLTEEDVNRVHEIMTCWKDLHNLAVDKQSKSRQLSAIHHEMQMVHKYLRDLENGLEQSNFDDIKAVEERIKYLQEAKLSISEQKSTLTSVDMRVSEFAEQNTDINMLRFKKECTAMCSRFKDIETRTLTRTAELQNLLLAWYDYSETSKELDYLLSQQRQHIQLMQAGQQILVMNKQEKAEAAIDLKNMLIELDGYEAKMASIRQLSSQLLLLCSTDTQTDIRASVGTLSNQLDALKHDCKRMVASLQASETTVDRIEENMEISPEAEVFVVGAEGLEAVGASDDVGLRQRKMEVDSEIESAVAADVPMETEEVVRESIPVASATVAAESSKVRPVSRWIGRLAFCRRILKVAIPLQILLILLFGLAMLLEPDCCEYFNNFRLTFAPQLRYVRGPPPI